MKIRENILPAGWYPRDSEGVSAFLSGFPGQKSLFRAAIAPHAGWYYCGHIAAKAIACLDKDTQTIVVLGGHLPAGSAPLFALEDAVRTPLGILSIDEEFRTALIKELNGKEDHHRDNTIEVLLPMVHYFFPKAKLLWLRLPADFSSFNAGKIITQSADKLNLKINVLASADLTHYGKNYGFSPKGTGETALKWVKEENDLNFIQAVEAGDAKKVLYYAESCKASCSAGSVLGVMGFADEAGLGKAKLLEYDTSAAMDKFGIPDSFVGYAAFTFSN